MSSVNSDRIVDARRAGQQCNANQPQQSAAIRAPLVQQVGNKMKIAIVVAAAALIAGCQTVAMETPASVSYSNVFDMQDSADKAQKHCSQYGKNAELMPHDQMGWDGMMHFRCV